MTERHQVPAKWCVTHDWTVREFDGRAGRCTYAAVVLSRDYGDAPTPVIAPCRLVPLFYETEGDNPQ